MLRSAAIVAVAAGAVLSTALSLPTAQAVPAPGPVDCPTSLPTASAVAGLVGTGYTVERGTVPERFSATVVGRISNGIAPGVDMIMAELDSPAITRAGGVWSGMSGSPVYAPDGRLIGAVSYGLAASSPIAGITPAASLETLLSADPDDAPSRARARISPDSAGVRALADTGEVTAQQASTGFRLLPVPLTVSGVHGAATATMVQALARRTGQRVVASGAVAQGAADPAAISGGSNFAAAVSYGDATLGAVGTTTYTCAGKVVAFGHPFLDDGVSTYSAHAASSVLVQPDAVEGPSKVANIEGVVGVVDRDRTLGLRSQLGAGPRGTQIRSQLQRVESGVTRVGSSTAVYQPLLSTAAAIHTLSNIDSVMGSTASRGTARLYLTVRGRTSNGRIFYLRVSQVFTAQVGDLPLDLLAASWVDDNLARLVDQPFDEILVDAVTLTGTVSSQASSWVSPRVQISQHYKYGAHDVVAVKAGAKLNTRTLFTQFRKPTVHLTKKLAVPVPKSARGQVLEVQVVGGSGYDVDEFFGDLLGGSSDPAASRPTSFAGVIARLQAAARDDRITVSVVDEDSGRVISSIAGRTSLPMQPFTSSAILVVR